MKKYLLWGLLLLIAPFALAQTPRTDIIHKTDRQTIEVRIDELTDTEIIYMEPSAPSVKKKIPRSEVWKVVFGDGSTEIVTPPSDATTATISTTGVDQITLRNKTVIPGKITRRDDQKLYYTKPEAPNGPQYELLLARLDKITYADGRTEEFSKAPRGNKTLTAEAKTPKSKPARQPKEKKTKVASYQAPAELASYKNTEAFERLRVTFGPEFSYYPDFMNKDRAWLNDSTGFGMKQNIGGSLRIDYRVLKPVAISISAGYYGWELLRRYTLNGLDEYTDTQNLTQIPLHLGVKLSPGNGFYVMPEGGIDLMFASIKTSDAHPAPANESITSSPITYGASIGTHINAGKLLFDLSLRYQILNVNNLKYESFSQNLKENVNVASIRLGIGFSTLKK